MNRVENGETLHVFQYEYYISINESPIIWALHWGWKSHVSKLSMCYVFYLPSLKRKCRHFDEILITGCTGSCHFDNFQCSQWRKFHQNEDISVSVMCWIAVTCNITVQKIYNLILEFWMMSRGSILSQGIWPRLSHVIDTIDIYCCRCTDHRKRCHFQTCFSPLAVSLFVEENASCNESAGRILGLHPANWRRRYFVATSLIGWAQAQNQPWICFHNDCKVYDNVILLLWCRTPAVCLSMTTCSTIGWPN